MNAFVPRNPATVILCLIILLSTLLLGFGITRLGSVKLGRALAWLLVLTMTVAVNHVCDEEPPGWRMLAIIGVLLFGMKAVVSVEALTTGEPKLTPLRWFAFAAFWFGMRPGLFARVGGPLPGAGKLIRSGSARLAAGIVLILLARWIWTTHLSWLPENVALPLATTLMLVGMSLVLHFGIFNIVAGAWRLAGIDCRALFRAPLRSSSLSDFWSRRWNLAFSEMSAIAIYRPVARLAGRGMGTFAAFLASGVLHELAISVPVKAGYGLPMLYFTIQGLLVLLEQQLERRGRPITRWGWLSRVWTCAWLVLPLPVLFHYHFLQGIIWPLLGIG